MKKEKIVCVIFFPLHPTPISHELQTRCLFSLVDIAIVDNIKQCSLVCQMQTPAIFEVLATQYDINL